MFLKSKKNKCYRWVSKDRITKFRINALSTRKRLYEHGAKKIFKDIKDRFMEQFLEGKNKNRKFSFTSDKLGHYKKGFKKYFYNIAIINHGVSIKAKKKGLKHNNNCIERDHQYSRKLEKNGRGNKSFYGITALFSLGDAYYNYIDKQKLLGKTLWRTPAEMAKIKLDLGDKYQLLNLIRISSADN